MHPYVSGQQKPEVLGAIAIVAVVASMLAVFLTSHFSWPQWLIGPPSLAATFAMLYRTFDKHWWNKPMARRLGLSTLPDISGTYDCRLISSFKDDDNNHIEKAATIDVHQTWTQMSVEMRVEGDSSSSHSVSAQGSIDVEGSATRLSYIYRNKAHAGIADEDMHDHEGAAELRIFADGKVEGTYYNNRPRRGTIQGSRAPR